MSEKRLLDGDELRSVWKVAARVPWPAVVSVCLYLPGIVLWAVYSLRCKAHTFVFLSTIAPVAQETVDAVTNTVNTTLITLAAGGTFIFALLLVLAIARSIQVAGVAPNAACPCARPTPSSYYLYRVFNMGFNIIVFFVNMAIILLMMGAFLWLVVAYAANLSIKFGVREAANSGIDLVQQFDLANQNYSTVVSYYEKQLEATPPCVVNTTWFMGLNQSISSILAPAPDATGAANTLLCPQSCLNLGSFATLFKLAQNCICNQEKLFSLQKHSLTVSTDAGVALGGSILIYLACCCLHTYLIGQYVHAGYDYKAAKHYYAQMIKQRRRLLQQQQQQRQYHGVGPPPSGDGGYGSDGPGPGGSGSHSNGVSGHSRGFSGDDDAVAVRVHSGTLSNEDEETGGSKRLKGKIRYNSAYNGYLHGDDQHMYDAGASGPRHADQQQQQQQQSHSRHGSSGSSRAAAAAATPTPTGLISSSGQLHHQRSSLERHSRQGSAGSSALGAAAAAAAAPAVGPSTGAVSGWSNGQYSTSAGNSSSGGAAGGSIPVKTGAYTPQQQHHNYVAPTPEGIGAAASGVHGRSESRSSGGSVRELLLGAVPLDHTGHNSGHGPAAAAAAAVAAAAAASLAAAAAAATSGSGAAGEGPAAAGTAREAYGSHHKPSSSSGSYESMIYHSPRNSDGANSSGALAGAAAAAGLLDVSPIGLAKMQQQQQHRHHQQQFSRGPTTILEVSGELPCVAAATAAEGGQAAASTTAAAGNDATDAPSSSIYDTFGSIASSGAGESLTGSLTGSGRRSRHSRKPAFDLTNIPTNFMLTVEGLEEQQELARSAANSRPCSPGFGGHSASYRAAAAAGTAAAVVDQRQQVPEMEGLRNEPSVGDTVPVSAAAAAAADYEQQQAELQQQQQQQQITPLSVRRSVAMPSRLQLPTEGQQQQQLMQQQEPSADRQVEQQQQQPRSLFMSPLLPPPEQQQLLLQQQQQQLALLLQQEQQHQWQQQQQLPHHHRQWSTPVSSATGSSTTSGGFQLQQQQQHHQHSASALNPAGAFGGGFGSYGGFGLSSSLPSQRDAYLQQPLGAAAAGLAYGSSSGGGGSGSSSAGGGLLFDSGSPAGSASMYNTPSGSPAASSTPVGTPGSALGFIGGSTPRGVASIGIGGSSSSIVGSAAVPAAAAAGVASSSGLHSPGGMQHSSSLGMLGSLGGLGGLPPTIPEASGYCSDGASADMIQQQQQQRPGGGGGGGGYGAAAAAGGPSDVATGSPLERRRSGYRSSMRKGLMAYDQYKHRQRYQESVSTPLDPRTELSRRYRNRVPAV